MMPVTQIGGPTLRRRALPIPMICSSCAHWNELQIGLGCRGNVELSAGRSHYLSGAPPSSIGPTLCKDDCVCSSKV